MSSHARDPWELDEASNLLKYNLCKIEFQRNSAISNVLERDGSVNASNFPDLWAPLRELTSNILPHMSFSRIEITNFDNMRCLFKVHSLNDEVDFDDLSSGEKSVIQTLYPLIEVDIQERLQAIYPQATIQPRKPYIIIDEPELHLHPSLQEKLVTYLRSLALTYGLRVVLATHSPTMIDAADEGDILLLRSRDGVADGENQIVALGSDPYKLRLVQESVGSVFPATAARPVLLIEGSSKVKVKNYSDKQIYTFLDPRFASVNLLPGGGKEDCLKSLRASRVLLAENPYGVGMYALLDRDLEQVDQPADGAYHLPVAMIENMCLKPQILLSALGAMRHASALQSDIDVITALLQICNDAKADEVSRRFRKRVRLATYALDASVITVADASMRRDEFISQIRGLDLDELYNRSLTEVELIEAEKTQLAYFCGKSLFTAFWSKYVNALSIGKAMYMYSCAQEVRKSGEYQLFFDDLFARIR